VTSLTGGQPNFARRLAVSWAATLYIHFRGLFCLAQFCPARCKIHFMSKSCILLHWQRYCTALQQRASAKICGMVQGMELHNFRTGRHLYWTGRPSRLTTGFTTGCIMYTNIQFNRLSNRFDNQLDVCLQNTAGCQTGCTTGCIV